MPRSKESMAELLLEAKVRSAELRGEAGIMRGAALALEATELLAAAGITEAQKSRLRALIARQTAN